MEQGEQTVEHVRTHCAHTYLRDGNAKSGLPATLLVWMIGRAESAGLPFDGTFLQEPPLCPGPGRKCNSLKIILPAESRGPSRKRGRPGSPCGVRDRSNETPARSHSITS